MSSACLQDKPDCLIIGLPPEFHGSVNDPAANIELECAEVRPSLASIPGVSALSLAAKDVPLTAHCMAAHS